MAQEHVRTHGNRTVAVDRLRAVFYPWTRHSSPQMFALLGARVPFY
jgi:hypothetical protein